MNEEEQTPTDDQPGAEQGLPDRDTPGREAEDVSRSQAEDVPGAGDGLSQEEVRERLEEQIRKLRIQDLMVESVVSVLNLTARRIAKEDERDLEQARVGIEAIRAWVDLLPEEAATQIRNALSELQVLFANVAEGKQPGAEQGGDPRGTPGSGAEDVPRTDQEERPPPPQPPPRGEPPPRLWTPPGSD